MSSNRCRIMEAHDKRDLVEISQLIDLTDTPIGLTRDEIGWAKVRANASNCICCCCHNSITLVTTDDSYILDHVPLDNIQYAQTNASLQYLAISNHRKIAIVDLVDNDINYDFYNNSSSASETKVINLTAHGLTMNDVLFWRWIDETNLAILSLGALYTCSVDQQHISHPAYTALSNRFRYLSMQKVFDLHQNISTFCQVYDIQRDVSGNFYAISSLYSTSSLVKLNSISNTQQQQPHSPSTPTNTPNTAGATLRSSFGSMPSRLSQLVNYDYSADGLKSEQSSRLHSNRQGLNHVGEDEICGLAQVYCKIRDRSQLIQVHAMTFTNSSPPQSLSPVAGASCSQADSSGPTILVAVNKIDNQMRVYFVEMASQDDTQTSGLNASPVTKFDRLSGIDFPTSIICSHVNSPDNDLSLHVALITTKHGQLFVCSVTHSTILFNITMANDIISSAILESNTRGLMVICRNGRVLLVKLNIVKLLKLLDESKTLRHISSASNIPLNSSNMSNRNDNNDTDIVNSKSNSMNGSSSLRSGKQSKSLDTGMEILVSTRL